MASGNTARFRALLVLTLSVSSILVACAGVRDTPQQAYVWEMGRVCDGRVPFWRMERVDPDGRYWIQGAINAPPGKDDYFACMNEQFAQRPYREWLGGASSLPGAPTAPAATGSVVAPFRTSGPTPGAEKFSSADPRLLTPVWAVGDRWSYRWHSPRGNGTFLWIMDRFQTIEGVDTAVIKSGDREIFYRVADRATILEMVSGVVEVRNTPPIVTILWPLQVGKSWTTAYARELPAARTTSDMLLDCRIDAEEPVTVPAGTFRAFRVICLNQRSGSLNHEFWYAPEVGNMVKDRTNFAYGVRERELVEFKRKASP